MDPRTGGGRRCGDLGELRVVDLAAFARPLAPAFLEEPEPVDVAEEAHRAERPDLVGEVVSQRFVSQLGLLELDAHE